MTRFVDRARMTTPTTGTGTLTLGSAVSAFQSFAAAGVVNGDTPEYLIEDGTAWEIGVGTYGSGGPTLTRALRSSSTGSLLSLSGSALVSVVPTALDISNLVVGATSGTDAAAGNIGEYLSTTVLTGSAVSMTSVTPATIASLALTAGDWDVTGNLSYKLGVTTVCNYAIAALSTVAATLPTRPGAGGFTELQLPFQTGAGITLQAGATRISVAAPTTVYLIGYCNFNTSTLAGYGFIGARRAR